MRHDAAHVCGEDLAAALDILATTDLADELLDSVHPLEDLAEQLERLATGQLEGKVLFDPALDPAPDPTTPSHSDNEGLDP